MTDLPDLGLHPEFCKGMAFATICAEKEIVRLKNTIRAAFGAMAAGNNDDAYQILWTATQDLSEDTA